MVSMLSKVLHLRSSGALLGAENVIVEIAKNSERFGYISIIGVVKDAQDSLPDILTVAKQLGLQTVVFEHHRMSGVFGCATNIRQYIEENNVDLLHCHGYKEDFFGVLSRSGISKVATNHLWKNTTVKLKLYRLFDIMLLRFFDRIVGVSDKLVAEMKKLGLKNVKKIPNGIDVSRFKVIDRFLSLYEQFGIPQGAVVLGMISSLTPEKNHRIAIESLSSLGDKHVVLLIVGSGKEKDGLEALVAEIGLESQVIFVGRQENIPLILSIIDIYLLPSLKEGLPMSLLEAMACGKAVIASRVGDNEQVATHKKNGLLVTAGNLQELIEAIKLLRDDLELRKILGENARNTVVAHFSSVLMAQRYCQLYDGLRGKSV